jgi:hypothetical protein
MGKPKASSGHSNKQGRSYQKLVGYVVKAFDQNASVTEEVKIEGPDGWRDMDVFVEGTIDGAPYKLLIECKDYSLKKTGKVGIGIVDALDSKRNDMGVNGAMIFSNSGFSKDAKRKAKRKRIGLFSALKAEDPRVKVVIEEEVYSRIVVLKSINIAFHNNVSPTISVKEIKYQGLPLENWVKNRIIAIISTNPMESADLVDSIRFVSKTRFTYPGGFLQISGFDIRFSFETQWYSHNATIDASLGMYDYIRGSVLLAPGQSDYIINGIDIHGGNLIDFIPQKDHLSAGLMPGKIQVDFILFKGLDHVPHKFVPSIDSLAFPDDLDLRIKSTQQ